MIHFIFPILTPLLLGQIHIETQSILLEGAISQQNNRSSGIATNAQIEAFQQKGFVIIDHLSVPKMQFTMKESALPCTGSTERRDFIITPQERMFITNQGKNNAILEVPLGSEKVQAQVMIDKNSISTNCIIPSPLVELKPRTTIQLHIVSRP